MFLVKADMEESVIIVNSSKFRNIAKSMFSCQLLKLDLARCMRGMNMVEGALNCSWVVLSNSKIKSGG